MSKLNLNVSPEDIAIKASDISFKRPREEPHVSIVGNGVDMENGMLIELDWNREFIEYLRSNGYSGASDESVVQKWMVDLYGDLKDRMSRDHS